MYAATASLNTVLSVWQNLEGALELDGSAEGMLEGMVDGLLEGRLEVEGLCEGLVDGSVEGTLEGLLDGVPEGSVEGKLEGFVEGLLEGFLLGTLVGAAVVKNIAVVVMLTLAGVFSSNFKSNKVFGSVTLISPAAIASWVSALSSVVKDPSSNAWLIRDITLISNIVVDVLSGGHLPGLQNSLRKIWNTTCR